VPWAMVSCRGICVPFRGHADHSVVPRSSNNHFLMPRDENDSMKQACVWFGISAQCGLRSCSIFERALWTVTGKRFCIPSYGCTFLHFHGPLLFEMLVAANLRSNSRQVRFQMRSQVLRQENIPPLQLLWTSVVWESALSSQRSGT